MSKRNENRPCPEWEVVLEERISGEISTEQSVALDKHLVECSACREGAQAAEPVGRLLRAALEPLGHDEPSFARLVMARIHEDDRLWEERGFWRPLIRVAQGLAFTAALGLALMLAYVSLRAPAEVSGVAVTAPANDIFAGSPYHPVNQDEILMQIAESGHGR